MHLNHQLWNSHKGMYKSLKLKHFCILLVTKARLRGNTTAMQAHHRQPIHLDVSFRFFVHLIAFTMELEHRIIHLKVELHTRTNCAIYSRIQLALKSWTKTIQKYQKKWSIYGHHLLSMVLPQCLECNGHHLMVRKCFKTEITKCLVS